MKLGETEYGVHGKVLLFDVELGASKFELRGKRSGDHITLDMMNFAFDRSFSRMPQSGRAELDIHEEGPEISGSWATDSGAYGVCRLFKAGWKEAFQLSIPFALRRILAGRRAIVKSLYLLFLVGIASASVTGYLARDMSMATIAIFFIPALYLFQHEIRGFFQASGVQKIGSLVEASEQAAFTEATVPLEAVNSLIKKKQEFEDLALFFYLNLFFVPRTKAIVSQLAIVPRPLTLGEFHELARVLGVPERNIQATYDALLQTECIRMDEEGRVHLTSRGKRFLNFETQLKQLLPSS